ncbi:MAG: thiamine phosphate synthase [Merdibacter sp.]
MGWRRTRLVRAGRAALKGGATFVQLREKQLDQGAFLEEAREIQALCRRSTFPLSSTIMWISPVP